MLRTDGSRPEQPRRVPLSPTSSADRRKEENMKIQEDENVMK